VAEAAACCSLVVPSSTGVAWFRQPSWRIKVGPDTSVGANQDVHSLPPELGGVLGMLLPTPTRQEAGVAVARHGRTRDLAFKPLADEAEPVRLRHTAGILWIRRRRVVVLPREDADRLRVRRTSSRFTVSSYLTGERGTSTCTRNGGRTDGNREQ
jgi:hypothetical protein